jgi:hypothetical protein
VEDQRVKARSFASTGTTILAVIAAVLAFFYMRSLHAGGMHGRAGEILSPDAPPSEWSYAPVANAEVLIIWKGTPLDGPVDVQSVCVRAAYARTDTNGNFSIDDWWLMPQWPLMFDVHAMLPAPVAGFKYPGWHELNGPLGPSPFTLRLVRIDRSVSPAGPFEEMDPIGLYRCPAPEPPLPARGSRPLPRR